MMVGWGWDGGLGIVWIVGILAMVAFWALILIGLFYGVRWLVRSDRNSRLPPEAGSGLSGREDPLEILRQRYARGEIDDEEFERRKRTLTGP